MIWLIHAQVVRLEQVRAAARTPFAPDDVHEQIRGASRVVAEG
jgi:hypothetical protein